MQHINISLFCEIICRKQQLSGTFIGSYNTFTALKHLHKDLFYIQMIYICILNFMKYHSIQLISYIAFLYCQLYVIPVSYALYLQTTTPFLRLITPICHKAHFAGNYRD